MKRSLISLLIIIAMGTNTFSQEKLGFNDLSKQESYVINNKGTEAPFTGKFTNYAEKALMYVKSAVQPFTIHLQSLNPTVDGQALMMK